MSSPRFVLSAVLLALALAATTHAQTTPPGGLDSRFGQHGFRLLDYGADDRAWRVIVTGSSAIDRRIIVAMIANNGVPALVALRTDGSIDAGFGTAGIAIGSGIASRIGGVVEGDGGELVLAYSDPYFGQADNEDFFLQAFSATGQVGRRVSVDATQSLGNAGILPQFITGLQAVDFQRAPDGSYYLVGAVSGMPGPPDANALIAVFDRNLNPMIDAGAALGSNTFAWFGSGAAHVSPPSEIVGGNPYTLFRPSRMTILGPERLFIAGNCIIYSRNGTPPAGPPFNGSSSINDDQRFGCAESVDAVLRDVGAADAFVYNFPVWDGRGTEFTDSAREPGGLTLYGVGEFAFYAQGRRRYPIIVDDGDAARVSPLFFVPPATDFGERTLSVVRGLRSNGIRYVIGSDAPCVASAECAGSDASTGFYLGATDGQTVLNSYVGLAGFGSEGFARHRVRIPGPTASTFSLAELARAYDAALLPSPIGGAAAIVVVGDYFGRTQAGGAESVNGFVALVTLSEITTEPPPQSGLPFKDGFE